MFHLIAGGEDRWRAPSLRQSVELLRGPAACTNLPTMRAAASKLRFAAACPYWLPFSAGQGSAPQRRATLAIRSGAGNGECLAGLVYVNAIKQGAPAIFGTWCFVSDLRTGAMSGSSPEQALLSAAKRGARSPGSVTHEPVGRRRA